MEDAFADRAPHRRSGWARHNTNRPSYRQPGLLAGCWREFSARDGRANMDEEERRKHEKPRVSAAQGRDLARDLFAVTVVAGSMRKLDSYDDVNVYMEIMEASEIQPVVLKVQNGVESSEATGLLEAQHEAMVCVRASGTWCPLPLLSARGRTVEFATVQSADGRRRQHAVRLFPYLPGSLQGQATLSERLARDVGGMLGRVNRALGRLRHPAVERTHAWDLRHFEEVVTRFLPGLAGDSCEGHVDTALRWYHAYVPCSSLPMSTCHGDLNDQNIILDAGGSPSGVLDFGDLVRTWTVADAAIGVAYLLIQAHYDHERGRTPAQLFRLAAAAIRGYEGYRPMSPSERVALPALIVARVATSVAVGAYSAAQDPHNDYLRLTARPGRDALAVLCSQDYSSLLAHVFPPDVSQTVPRARLPPALGAGLGALVLASSARWSARWVGLTVALAATAASALVLRRRCHIGNRAASTSKAPSSVFRSRPGAVVSAPALLFLPGEREDEGPSPTGTEPAPSAEESKVVREWGQFGIVLGRSADGWRTWGAAEVLADRSVLDAYCAVSSPCPAVDLHGGGAIVVLRSLSRTPTRRASFAAAPAVTVCSSPSAATPAAPQPWAPHDAAPAVADESRA